MIREREVYGLGFMLNQPCHTFMPSLPGNDEPDDDDVYEREGGFY